MPNYYELLQITPGASDAEILAAYETQYNQWRRLVTHHDPNVVNQANQALQALETIRQTLGDPSRRAAYDAGIGLAGPIGGLADPATLLQSLQRPAAPAPMAPPPPAPMSQTTTTAPATMATPGLWACAKCGTDNPAQTKFCFKCGNQLVRTCPECRKETSLIATGMCGECGYSYDRAMQRQEIKQQIATLQQELGPKQTAQTEELKAAKGSSAITWGVILLVAGLACSVGGSNTLVVGLICLIFGGMLLFGGYNSNRQHNSNATNLADQIQQIESKQRQLQSDLDTMPNR